MSGGEHEHPRPMGVSPEFYPDSRWIMFVGVGAIVAAVAAYVIWDRRRSSS